MPAGHPAVHDDEGEDEGGRALPQDVSSDDATVPAGVLIVTIKDAEERPVPHVPVTLGIQRSSVTRGESSDRRVGETDDAGGVRFDGLPHGTGYSFRLSTSRGAASFVLPTFGLNDRSGKRAVLHSYEASAILDNAMMVVMRGAVGVSLREDSIQVQQLVTVINVGRVAWLADMPVDLPAGFKAFNKQETSDDARVEEVAGKGAALRGTFPPGQRELEFHYQVPLEGEATQTLHIRLPQRVSQTRVIAESSKTMALDVRGFPPAKHVQGRDGRRLLITDLAARSPGEASSLDITLSGLPTPGPGRWIAVVLAAVALAAGIAYVIQSRGAGNEAPDPDTTKDLAEAREALLDEIVELERARKAGEIGPKTYARVKASLLDALARIVAMIEASAPKPARGKTSRRRTAPT